MKPKVAKRTASEYEESLSSQDSCGESVVVRVSREDVTGETSKQSNIILVHECWTPPKVVVQHQNFSMEKLVSNTHHQWEGEGEWREHCSSLWRHGSQDSKIRSKQGASSQQPSTNYNEHVKVLRFDEDRYNLDHDKENEQIRGNTEESVSDGEVEEWTKELNKNKRVVGRELYFDGNYHRKITGKLTQIVEEEYQAEEFGRRVSHCL